MDVEPPFSGGLDTNTHPALLGPDKGRDLRNIVLINEALARRDGSVKTTVFTDATDAYGTKVLGTGDAKYAWFTPPLIPKGGFALKGADVMNRPNSGTVYLFSSWTDGSKAHGVVWATLSSAGSLVFKVEWSSAVVTTLTATAPADGTETTWLLVYDPAAGTLTLYLDGEQAAQATGLASTLQPRQDASVKWYLGLSYTPGTGPDSGTGLDGAMGPFIGFAFRGADLTAGASANDAEDTSLLHELRAGTFQDWPNPASRMILFHYPMRESATGDLIPMIDRSKFKNDGAYVGTPSTAVAIVWNALNGNYVGNVRKALIGAQGDGSLNVVGVGGAVYAEVVERPK